MAGGWWAPLKKKKKNNIFLKNNTIPLNNNSFNAGIPIEYHIPKLAPKQHYNLLRKKLPPC